MDYTSTDSFKKTMIPILYHFFNLDFTKVHYEMLQKSYLPTENSAQKYNEKLSKEIMTIDFICCILYFDTLTYSEYKFNKGYKKSIYTYSNDTTYILNNSELFDIENKKFKNYNFICEKLELILSDKKNWFFKDFEDYQRKSLKTFFSRLDTLFSKDEKWKNKQERIDLSFDELADKIIIDYPKLEKQEVLKNIDYFGYNRYKYIILKCYKEVDIRLERKCTIVFSQLFKDIEKFAKNLIKNKYTSDVKMSYSSPDDIIKNLGTGFEFYGTKKLPNYLRAEDIEFKEVLKIVKFDFNKISLNQSINIRNNLAHSNFVSFVEIEKAIMFSEDFYNCKYFKKFCENNEYKENFRELIVLFKEIYDLIDTKIFSKVGWEYINQNKYLKTAKINEIFSKIDL